MNETKGCIVLLFTMFLLFFFFLLTAQVCTAKNLEAFMQEQKKLNEMTYRQDAQQDKEIRLLMQDAEINRNILTSKEFIQE